MRRGLIGWSRQEVPVSVLDDRVALLKREMAKERLDAALAYTSFAQPASVAWLTHFVPYWNEAMVAIFPAGAPLLLAALTKRVHPWIREVSHVGEVLSAPDLGRSVAKLLKERLPASARVGVIGLDGIPWAVVDPIAKTGHMLVDASALYARIRQPADAAEIELARRTSVLALKALDAVPRGARLAAEVLSVIESSARLDGAEEVILRLAPDLSRDGLLRRIEGEVSLGDRYAVEVSMAYKATWLRRTRCFGSGKAPDSWKAAEQWFSAAISNLNESNYARGPEDPLPGKLVSWTMEASIGCEPLSIVVHGKPPAGVAARAALPRGSLVNLSVQLDLKDGPWHCSAPLVLGDPSVFKDQAPMAVSR